MYCKLISSLCLLSILSLASSHGAESRATSDAFDLAQRKDRLPWIWETPRRHPAPKVRQTDWPRTDIDRFLLARLERENLTPAPDTDPRTWLRRVHFAVTGLPPTLAELREFLADASDAGRARAVDQLLASPHYGERWARHWMDLVRYAESRGHESDFIIANAWHYRDYLIRAFNADVPYDQFVLEHTAGDLLPQPRLDPLTGGNESVLATGWAFLGEEVHSPVDIRQDECERNDNKVDVFSKTFLGLTVACARCHDHKFDAITSRDYYALTGFILGSSYRQVRYESMETNRLAAQRLAVLRDRYRPQFAAALASTLEPGFEQIPALLLAARDAELELAKGQNEDDQATRVQRAADRHHVDAQDVSAWLEYLRNAARLESDPFHPLARAALTSMQPDGPGACRLWTDRTAYPDGQLPQEATVIADFTTPDHQPWKADGYAFGSGPSRVGDLCLGTDETRPIDRIMTYGAARRDSFWNRLRTAPGNQDDSGSLAATSRAGQMIRTPTFTLQSGKLHYLLRGKAKVYAAVDSHIMITGPLHGRLVQTFDTGIAEQPRWVTHDLSPYSGHRTHLEFGPEGDADLEILMVVESPSQPTGMPMEQHYFPERKPSGWTEAAQLVGEDLRRACRLLAQNELNPQADSASSRDVLLANWLVRHRDLVPRTGSAENQANAEAEATLRALSREYAQALEVVATQVRWESKTAVAWFDGTGVDENVLLRGKPFRPGTTAERSLPVAFRQSQPIRDQASSGRLELGRELIDPENPLVSRVMVNRVWHHLFGRGLVATVDNFGYLGARPSHPELLDDLAWRFTHQLGWSLKRLLRELLLSRAFAMSSHAGDKAAETQDPDNQLLHRMPVRRLEAEVIRDALLTVSGRLNPTVGGPPVPVHLTEFVVGRGRPEQSGPLDGDGRRSIYTAVRRNFLPTMMLSFDLPTPFSTVGRRNVTNVPAQSLVLMNDPLFHEQAQLWADRMLRETPDAGDDVRVQWLFETAYGRPATTEELKACRDSLAELRGWAAGEGQTNRSEVWKDLGHVLLNANDFIYVK